MSPIAQTLSRGDLPTKRAPHVHHPRDVGTPRNEVAPANFFDLRAQNQSFEAIGAYGPQDINLTGDGEPQKVEARGVTANFFPLLGVKPSAGRWFLADEDKPGSDRVVMLSHALWQQRFGGTNVLGRQILLNGEKYTVIGVMQFPPRE